MLESTKPVGNIAHVALLTLFFAAGAAAQAPTASQSSASAKQSCTVTRSVPTDADRALARRDFATADTLYRAQLAAAGTDTARAAANTGIVRTQLAAGKLNDALATIKKAMAESPSSAQLQDVLGEVYFRRGEPFEAAGAWNTAQHIDFCNPRVHYDIARFQRLNGNYASEQKQLDLAHRLAPDDRMYSRAVAPRVQMTVEERVARLTDRLENENLSTEDRESLQRSLDVVRAQSKGSCEIVHPMDSTKIPIVPISNGPTDMYGIGLDLQLNGKKKRFQIDTGASGLLISRSVAASAGLISEAESRGGGLGDSGPVKELLAHVDSLRIGQLEFHNCLVRVFDKKNVLDVDGLISTDVFSAWLVTLDIPSREVRLNPLPKRPDDDARPSELDTAGQGENAETIPRDRYIAPEMKDWTQVFRYGHDLIFPTLIGKTAASKLFIMDTGASRTLISPAAAKEVTGVGGSEARVKGISGQVKDVSEADSVDIVFAKVRSPLRNILAVDTSGLGRGSGVEISGLIGFETLRQLVITIDYRDNLVHIVYDPTHGFH